MKWPTGDNAFCVRSERTKLVDSLETEILESNMCLRVKAYLSIQS